MELIDNVSQSKRNVYLRNHYRTNATYRQKHIDKGNERTKRLWREDPEFRKRCEQNHINRKNAIREWFYQLKLTMPCKVCGESDPACIDFHHRDRSTKQRGVGHLVQLGRKKQLILAEIEKCDPMCANCHRKLHWKERKGSL